MNIKKLWLIVAIFITSQALIANASSSIQTYFNKWAKTNGIIGTALAINDQSFFYGYSNKQLALPVNPQTEFGIGSITKTFVSVILLKLEANGKLNIHDSVIKYFPQYHKLKDVTIQELMQMTAGFNDVTDPDHSMSPIQEVNKAYGKYNPALAGVWQYSNVSYQLLGILIEKITKQSLAQELSVFITLPLHLNSIYFPTKFQSENLKEYQNGQVKTSNFTDLYAEGGLVSNAHDLEIFIRHLFVLKDLLPVKQYAELTTFINTPVQYYAFTGTKAPEFGLGVFKWNISPYGNVFTYPGVLKEGFTSAFTVIGNNVIISQSNTYNHNDFTILWPHRTFTKDIVEQFGKLKNPTRATSEKHSELQHKELQRQSAEIHS